MPEIHTKLAEAITATAIRLFRERGFDEVSVNDICREAGIVRNMAPPESLGSLGIDAVYKVTCDWRRRSGQLPSRELARRNAEILYAPAPEYRWMPEKREHTRHCLRGAFVLHCSRRYQAREGSGHEPIGEHQKYAGHPPGQPALSP